MSQETIWSGKAANIKHEIYLAHKRKSRSLHITIHTDDSFVVLITKCVLYILLQSNAAFVLKVATNK